MITNLGHADKILKTYDHENWTKSSSMSEALKRTKNNVESFDFSQHQTTKEVSFADFLKNSVEEVNNWQVKANHALQELATGKSKNIHETMLLVEKADLAFKTMNQIRNKVIDTYKEIMRIQI